MTQKRLLILGGNRYNIRSVQAAREAGFYCMVADKNPQAPAFEVADVPLPIDLFDYDGLLKAVEKHGSVDGVVSMAEVGVRPAAYLASQLNLPTIGEQAAANATSKAAMRRLWSQDGYSVDFRVVHTEAEALAAVTELGEFPLLFKPDRSLGGSRGVSRVDSQKDVSAAFQFAQSGALPGSAIVVEQFISGSEYSAEVLIWNGKTSVLCVGQKVKSPLPYRVDISVQYPAPLSEQQWGQIAAMCQSAIAALGVQQGVAHVEFAYTEHGPLLFELGVRCGGGHTPQIAHQVSGVNEFVEYCRISCGLPPQQFTPMRQHGADYRFLVYPPGVFQDAVISSDLLQHPGVLDVGITFAPGQMINPLRTTAERAGFVVTTAATREEAVQLADWGCQQVTIHYDDGATAHAYQLADFISLRQAAP